MATDTTARIITECSTRRLRSSSRTLGPLYQALAPWAEALLRVGVGLALVPHGLRNTFGIFPEHRRALAQSHGVGARSSTATAIGPENSGRRRSRSRNWSAARCWRSVCSPVPAALAIVVFLLVANYERWRVGGYFWNKLGLEYTLMWTLAAFYFLVHGGGAISLDHLLIGREF